MKRDRRSQIPWLTCLLAYLLILDSELAHKTLTVEPSPTLVHNPLKSKFFPSHLGFPVLGTSLVSHFQSQRLV